MVKLLQFPWGLFTLSTIVSAAAGIAILTFGAPPAILVVAPWAVLTVHMALSSRLDRRIGRR